MNIKLFTCSSYVTKKNIKKKYSRLFLSVKVTHNIYCTIPAFNIEIMPMKC